MFSKIPILKYTDAGIVKIENAVQLFKEAKLEEINEAGPAHSGMGRGNKRGILDLNLCILSGKGGTGKTTVATNLSLITGHNYIDCDVEEPNGFIFLKPGPM